MQKFNVCAKKTYTKNGEEKATWPSVGSIVIFPASGDKEEGGILELNMFPGVKFNVFPQKDKNKNDDDL
jgi:hypothetical protein